MTVLVVEQHESNMARPLQDLLEAEGHTCLTARDWDEADWQLRQVAVDALVIDLDTPGADPIEWIERLHQVRPELASSSIVVAGGKLDGASKLKLRALGATLLRKHVPIHVLRDAVLGELGQRRRQAGRLRWRRAERGAGPGRPR